MTDRTHPFIEYLETLRDDRGALAALRRGLGQPAGTVASTYPYVVRWLPENAGVRQEAPYYLIASLFAYHPASGSAGNMGSHFARAREPGGDDTALERRFTTLLAAHSDDLPTYLRQAVSFLRSKEVPIDWHRLFYDVQRWGYDNRPVQREWARAFWGRTQEEEANKEE